MLELDTDKSLTLDINSNHSVSLNVTGNRDMALTLSVPKTTSGASIKSNTTEYWNNSPTFIPKRSEIIVYTDYATKVDGGGSSTIVFRGKTVNKQVALRKCYDCLYVSK